MHMHFFFLYFLSAFWACGVGQAYARTVLQSVPAYLSLTALLQSVIDTSSALNAALAALNTTTQTAANLTALNARLSANAATFGSAGSLGCVPPMYTSLSAFEGNVGTLPHMHKMLEEMRYLYLQVAVNSATFAADSAQVTNALSALASASIAYRMPNLTIALTQPFAQLLGAFRDANNLGFNASLLTTLSALNGSFAPLGLPHVSALKDNIEAMRNATATLDAAALNLTSLISTQLSTLNSNVPDLSVYTTAYLDPLAALLGTLAPAVASAAAYFSAGTTNATAHASGATALPAATRATIVSNVTALQSLLNGRPAAAALAAPCAALAGNGALIAAQVKAVSDAATTGVAGSPTLGT